MRDAYQAVWGMLAAIFSALLVFGGLAISLTEARIDVAQAPTLVPTSTIHVPTQLPGEPTYTPSPTFLPTTTPTIAFPNSCDYPPGWVEISVGAGDTLAAIAERYMVSVNILRSGNCLVIDGLMAGMSIHVPLLATETPIPSYTPTLAPTQAPITKPTVSCPRPPGWVIYYVRSGDTLFRIGLAVGVHYTELAARNCLGSYNIYTGQRLYVPRLPVYPPTATPLPYLSPTPIPPVSSPTSIPPTSVPPTPVRPSATPIANTATPELPTMTPITPSPTLILPTATLTDTPPPATQTPSPTTLPTNTPLPQTATPVPSATATSIPLPTRTPPTLVITPRETLVTITPQR